MDPLAEDYVYNSTYAFAENRVIEGFELEGLEMVHVNSSALGRQPGEINERDKAFAKNTINTAGKVLGKAASNAKVTASFGPQIGLKLGKFGGEINLGSKDIGTMDSRGNFTEGDGSTTEGFSLAAGVAEFSVDVNTQTSTEDIDITSNIGDLKLSTPGIKQKTTIEGEQSLTVLGFGLNTTKTAVNHSISDGFGNTTSEGQSIYRDKSGVYNNTIGDASKKLINSTKLSVAFGIKIEFSTSLE